MNAKMAPAVVLTAEEKQCITLTAEEKQRLEAILDRPVVAGASPEKVSGRAGAAVLPRMHVRSRVLLLLAEDHAEEGQKKAKMKRMTRIAKAAGCTYQTVYAIRRIFTQAKAGAGVDAVLTFNQSKLLTPAIEDRILALSRTPPPPAKKGKQKDHWTLALLAEALVEQGIVERISLTALHRILVRDEALRRAAEQEEPALPAQGFLARQARKRVPSRRPVLLTRPEYERVITVLRDPLQTPEAKTRAMVLLHLAQHVPGRKQAICTYLNEEVASLCQCSVQTVVEIRRHFVERGLEGALARKKRGLSVPRY